MTDLYSGGFDFFASLADGVAGFDAGGAQQTRDLLEMQLHRVSAQDLGLREADAGVPDLVHARFEIGNVLFEMDAFGRLAEAPAVNAAGDVVEPGVNVVGEVREHRLQLLREAVFVAVFDGEFEGQERVKSELPNCVSRLKPSRQPGPPGSLRAASRS